MKSENEKLREAARMLSRNCEERLDSCKGCLFCRSDLLCKLRGVPAEWNRDFGLDEHIVDVNKKYGTPTDTPTETDTPTDTPTDTVAPTDAPTASGKTRQERFLEMFPHAIVFSGALNICPGDIDVRYTCRGPKDCTDCKKEYWLAAEKEEKS